MGITLILTQPETTQSAGGAHFVSWKQGFVVSSPHCCAELFRPNLSVLEDFVTLCYFVCVFLQLVLMSLSLPFLSVYLSVMEVNQVIFHPKQ